MESSWFSIRKGDLKSGELLGTFPFTRVTEGVSSFLFAELLFSFPDPGVFGTSPSNLHTGQYRNTPRRKGHVVFPLHSKYITAVLNCRTRRCP